jgi:hypothetical protein
MENYELYIPPKYNKKNGRFYPGHIPFNKGKKQSEWMDGRKIRKVKKYLILGRHNYKLPGLNKIEIVGIKDGKLTAFKSAVDAEKILRAKGIKVNQRNIRTVCLGSIDKKGYIRLKAGGYKWFHAKDVKKYKHLIE